MGARVDRRAVLALAAAGIAGGGLAAGLLATPDAPAQPRVSPEPLRAHARRRGLSFGVCVLDSQLAAGNRLAPLIAREADTIVPGVALKWGPTEPVRGHPDYAAAERIAAFATAHRLRLRGHTAFWYRNVPAWAAPLLATPEGPALMLRRVSDVVGHFRGRVFEWDVINEAVEPHDEQPGLIRRAPFARPMDVAYMADLFAAAHAADPAARLYYNDYLLEGMLPYEVRKRAAVLELLAALRRRGAPIHGLGIQSHIATHLPFQPAPFRAFLREVAAMGLDIRLTELDVGDRKTRGTIEQRDRQLADLAYAYLSTAFDETAVKGLITWGLRDADAYVPPERARADGLPQRALPYDDDLRRKPMWSAIARAFDGAPPR